MKDSFMDSNAKTFERELNQLGDLKHLKMIVRYDHFIGKRKQI